MSYGIYDPGAVENATVSESSEKEKRNNGVFVPEVNGAEGGEAEADEEVDPRVAFVLEHDDGVFSEVVEVEFFACGDGLRGFF